MKKFIILLFLLVPSILPAQDMFNPDDWCGNWKGTLEIISGGKTSSVPMELNIAKTESAGKYSWIIVYGEGESRQERKYELLERDGSSGLFDLDEKNGIILEMLYSSGRFYSVFDVEGMLISAVYRLYGGNILFEIISADLKKPYGNYTTEEDSLRVNSYHINVNQNSVLSRTEN